MSVSHVESNRATEKQTDRQTEARTERQRRTETEALRWTCLLDLTHYLNDLGLATPGRSGRSALRSMGRVVLSLVGPLHEFGMGFYWHCNFIPPPLALSSATYHSRRKTELFKRCLSVCPDCPSLYITIYMSVRTSVRLSVYPPIYLSICLSVRPSVKPRMHSSHPSIHPSVHLVGGWSGARVGWCVSR